MQKKRVRIYKPNNDNKVMYANGGMSPNAAMQGAPQGISSSNQGADLQNIISTYAQSKGMSEEETNQLYNQIVQLPQDQQQQAMAQMAQELSASQTPIARYGGDISSKKRLMNKRIGGVSPNTSAENEIANRRETVMKIIGAHLARYTVDSTYDDINKEDQDMRAQMQNQQSGIQELGQARNGLPNPFNPYAKNNRGQDYGSPFYNAGTDPTAFTKQVNESQAAVQVANKRFGEEFLNMGLNLRPGKIKVKTKGDMFNKPQPSVWDENLKPAMDENGNQITNTGDLYSWNSNNMPTLQDGGGHWDSTGTNWISGIESRDINEGKLSTGNQPQQYNWNGNNNEGAKDTIDPLGSGELITSAEAERRTSNQNSSSGAGSNGFTGDMGGYRFVDGKIVGNSGQDAGAGGYGVDPRAYRNQIMNPFGYLTSPQGMEAFGSAMKDFQPDDVYLSKLKGRMGPFGNKFVAKWNYGPDGQPIEDDGRLSQGTDLGHRDRNYGKLDQAFDRVRANINDRRGEGNYERHTGHGVNQGNDYDMSVNNSTGYGGSGMGAMERLDSDKQPVKVQPAIPQSSSGYPEPSPYDPRMDYVPEQFDNGGMAGKLTIKQGYTPSGTSLASGLIAGMDMVSANKNVQQLSENAFLPDNIVPVLSDSRRRNPGGRGTWGVGPGLIGQETADNQPFDEYDGSGNPGNDLSSQFNYQDNYNMSRKGGKTYQPGGTTDDGGLYTQALGERQFFIDNPDAWQGDPEMTNPDGSLNLCLDCINVDWNSEQHIRDAARLINEGYTTGTHRSLEEFNKGLSKYGIPQPVYGSAKTTPIKRKGGPINFYEEGGVYELDEDEIQELYKLGGTIEYLDR